eukprot:1553310-Prymnesium_polylepis.1
MRGSDARDVPSDVMHYRVAGVGGIKLSPRLVPPAAASSVRARTTLCLQRTFSRCFSSRCRTRTTRGTARVPQYRWRAEVVTGSIVDSSSSLAPVQSLSSSSVAPPGAFWHHCSRASKSGASAPASMVIECEMPSSVSLTTSGHRHRIASSRAFQYSAVPQCSPSNQLFHSASVAVGSGGGDLNRAKLGGASGRAGLHFAVAFSRGPP